MTDIYRAPDFNFKQEPGESSASLQRAIEGDYSFSAFDTIDETWREIKGKKGMLWVGLLLTIAVSIGVSMATSLISGLLGHASSFATAFHSASFQSSIVEGGMAVVANMAQTLITLPVQLGFFMYMLKRLAGLPTEIGELFQYFSKTLSFFLTTLLMYLLVALGFLCLILPGIYLLVAYMFANDLVVEKGLSPWEALEASRKAVTHHWWRFLGFTILNGLIMILAILPLFITAIASIHRDWGTIAFLVFVGGMLTLLALVWVLPATTLAKPVLYRKVFGCEGEENVDAEAVASVG
jgi:uncharacterized membrane protein